jgi:hypothetical protein
MREFEQPGPYEDDGDGRAGLEVARPVTGRFAQLRRLVLALSGAHAETLELLPTERVRFESLGWAILITSGMAALSMWFALSSALGVNGLIAVFPAVLWGLVIMGIDRWLITSMPIDGKRKFAMAAPRLVLAILLGTLISTPLVLRVFESEINAQISAIKEVRYSNFLTQQQNSKVTQQVNSLASQVAYLNKVIDSHGAAVANTSGDPQLQALNSQLSRWTSLENTYLQQWNCQLYGGPQCVKKGNGPLAQASEASYLQAKAQVSKIQGEIQQRDAQLSSTSKSDELARYNQAKAALPAVQNQYNTALARQQALQANFYAQNQATNGILIRLQALSQLSTGDFTVTAARFLLFLLFLVIECLPVTVKLLQRPGLYEDALRAARAAERRDAEKFYRTRSRLGSVGHPAGRTILRMQAEHMERDIDVRPLWNRTVALPRAVRAPEDERATEAFYPHDPGRQRHFDEYDPPRAGLRPGERQRHEPDEEVFPGRLHRDGPRPDPGQDQTRLDIPYGQQTRHDDEPRQDRRAAGGDEVPSVHQALSEMDDRVAASPDGHDGGVPLRWDDE